MTQQEAPLAEHSLGYTDLHDEVLLMGGAALVQDRELGALPFPPGADLHESRHWVLLCNGNQLVRVAMASKWQLTI